MADGLGALGPAGVPFVPPPPIGGPQVGWGAVSGPIGLGSLVQGFSKGFDLGNEMLMRQGQHESEISRWQALMGNKNELVEERTRHDRQVEDLQRQLMDIRKHQANKPTAAEIKAAEQERLRNATPQVPPQQGGFLSNAAEWWKSHFGGTGPAMAAAPAAPAAPPTDADWRMYHRP